MKIFVLIILSCSIISAQATYVTYFYGARRKLETQCNQIERNVQKARQKTADEDYDILYAGNEAFSTIMPSSSLSIVTPRSLRFGSALLEQRLASSFCNTSMDFLTVKISYIKKFKGYMESNVGYIKYSCYICCNH